MGNTFQRKKHVVNTPTVIDTTQSFPAPIGVQTPINLQANVEHARRFGHSLARIALHRPEHDEARRPGTDAHLSVASPQIGAIQRKEQADGHGASAQDATPEEIQLAAQEGIGTPVTVLPYKEQIQRAFGHHHIEQIQAHLNPQATLSAQKAHAAAYTTGNHVVFAEAPDLHTAAHEATHVIQQRAGIQLPASVGRVGDSYERQADTVATRVMQGQSVEHILDATQAGQQVSTQQVPT